MSATKYDRVARLQRGAGFYDFPRGGRGVLFASEGTMEREIGQRFGTEAKLSIYRSIFVPILTYGHEGWVMTERTKTVLASYP